jgi:hypothetical protein
MFDQNKATKMNKNDQNSKRAVDERYGVPVYQSNPSIPLETEIKRSKRAQIGTDMRPFISKSESALGRIRFL